MTGMLMYAAYDRRQSVDLSTPLLTQDNSIVYKTLPLEPNIAGFVLPFTPLVSLGHFKYIMLTKNIMHKQHMKLSWYFFNSYVYMKVL